MYHESSHFKPTYTTVFKTGINMEAKNTQCAQRSSPLQKLSLQQLQQQLNQQKVQQQLQKQLQIQKQKFPQHSEKQAISQTISKQPYQQQQLLKNCDPIPLLISHNTPPQQPKMQKLQSNSQFMQKPPQSQKHVLHPIPMQPTLIQNNKSTMPQKVNQIPPKIPPQPTSHPLTSIRVSRELPPSSAVYPPPPPPPTKTEKALACSCCPYGYHIDLDFLEYLDSTKESQAPLKLYKKRSNGVKFVPERDDSTKTHYIPQHVQSTHSFIANPIVDGDITFVIPENNKKTQLRHNKNTPNYADNYLDEEKKFRASTELVINRYYNSPSYSSYTYSSMPPPIPPPPLSYSPLSSPKPTRTQPIQQLPVSYSPSQHSPSQHSQHYKIVPSREYKQHHHENIYDNAVSISEQKTTPSKQKFRSSIAIVLEELENCLNSNNNSINISDAPTNTQENSVVEESSQVGRLCSKIKLKLQRLNELEEQVRLIPDLNEHILSLTKQLDQLKKVDNNAQSKVKAMSESFDTKGDPDMCSTSNSDNSNNSECSAATVKARSLKAQTRDVGVGSTVLFDSNGNRSSGSDEGSCDTIKSNHIGANNSQGSAVGDSKLNKHAMSHTKFYLKYNADDLHEFPKQHVNADDVNFKKIDGNNENIEEINKKTGSIVANMPPLLYPKPKPKDCNTFNQNTKINQNSNTRENLKTESITKSDSVENKRKAFIIDKTEFQAISKESKNVSVENCKSHITKPKTQNVLKDVCFKENSSKFVYYPDKVPTTKHAILKNDASTIKPLDNPIFNNKTSSQTRECSVESNTHTLGPVRLPIDALKEVNEEMTEDASLVSPNKLSVKITPLNTASQSAKQEPVVVNLLESDSDSDVSEIMEECEDDLNVRQTELQCFDEKTKQLQAVNETIEEEFIVKRNSSSESQKAAFQHKLQHLQQMLQQDSTQQPPNNSYESSSNTVENNVKQNKGVLNKTCNFGVLSDESSNKPTNTTAYQIASLSFSNANFSCKTIGENSNRNANEKEIRNNDRDNKGKEDDDTIKETRWNDEKLNNSTEGFKNDNNATKNMENNKEKENTDSNNNEKTAVSELTLKEAKVYAISTPLNTHNAASPSADHCNDFYISKSSIPYSAEDQTVNENDQGLMCISEINNTSADSESIFNRNNLNEIEEEVIVKSVKPIRAVTNGVLQRESEPSVSSSSSFLSSDVIGNSKEITKNSVISEFNYRLFDEGNNVPSNVITSTTSQTSVNNNDDSGITTSPKNVDQNKEIIIGGVVLSNFVDNIITDSLNEINCRFNERNYSSNIHGVCVDKEVNYNAKQATGGFEVLTEFNLEKIEKFTDGTEVKATIQSSSSSSSRPVSLLSTTSVSSSSSLTSQQHFINKSSNDTSSSSTFHDTNSTTGNSTNDKDNAKDHEKDKTENASTDDSVGRKPEDRANDSFHSTESNGTTKRYSKMLAHKKLFADILVSDVTLTTTSDSSPDSELWHPMKSKNRPKVDDRTTFLGAGKYSSCHTSGAISDPGELAMPKSPEFKSSSSLEDDPSSSSSNGGDSGAAKKEVVGVTTKRKVYHLDTSKQSGKLSDGSSDVSSSQCKEFSSGDFLSNSDEFKPSSQNSISSLGNMIVQKSVNEGLEDAYRDDQETPKAENFEQQKQALFNVSYNSFHSATPPSSVHSFHRKFSPHSHHLSAYKLMKRSFSASSIQERESPSIYESYNITSQSLDAGINEELANIRNPLHFSSLKHTTELQDITTNANTNIHLHIPADLSFKLSSDLSSIGDDGSYMYDEDENLKVDKNGVEGEDGDAKYHEYRVGSSESNRFIKVSSYSTNIRDLETIIDEEEEDEEEEDEDDEDFNSNKRENEHRDNNVVLHVDNNKNKGINASQEKTNAKVFGVKDEEEEEEEEEREDVVKQSTSTDSKAVKERSPDLGDDCFVEACSIYADHLNNQQLITDNEKETVLELIKKSWFLTCGRKMSRGEEVSDMLDALKKFGTYVTRDVINMKDNDGNTVLHYAISHVNDSVINVLLGTHLCDINIQNNAGYTALMLAALLIDDLSRHRHLLSSIFNMGNINASSEKSGQTALMLACSHKRLEVVALLLECGADVNLQDEDGSTALMCACEHGHLEVVRLLLTHPLCDSTICDLDGSTALSISMEEGHQEIGVLVYAHAKAITDARELHGS